jgi:protease PrsW
VFNIVIALVPVIVLLAVLVLMDRFKMVRPSSVLLALAAGAGAAFLSLALNDWLLHVQNIPPRVVSRYIAPIVEETAKALFIVGLIAAGRIGFPVDAAVQGFAVGTGFALIENLSYLRSMPAASPAVWIIRGLGTAVLQGTTTMIFAMISKTLSDRRQRRWILAFVPGWTAAVVIHSTFNHRVLPPLAQTLLLLIGLPLLALWVFDRSERATREWVGAGLDLDIELLNLVGSEHFGVTHFGRYLQQLRAHTPGPIVADMFCLLRLELELSVQAKALLMAREAGLELPADDDLEAILAERRYLHQSIGKAGLLALKPLGITSHRDQWHRHLLQQGRARTRAGS